MYFVNAARARQRSSVSCRSILQLIPSSSTLRPNIVSLITRNAAMSLLRLTFVIVRKPSVPPQVFEDLLCEPALELDLGGRIQYEGSSRFTVMLEGNRRNVESYKTYIAVAKPAIGQMSHFTEYTPMGRAVFGDTIDVCYDVQKRGTQREIDDDIKM